MIIPAHKFDDRDLIDFIGRQESQNIESANYYIDDILTDMENGELITGDKLPWSKTHENIRFRMGEVSIWAGMNGHKKSMLLGQVLMWFSQQSRVGVASFEMPVKATIKRMISQAAGCYPSAEYSRDWASWSDQKLFFYDQLDTVPPERVLGVIYYMATELGIKHIGIDSLTKCGISYGDREEEKRFIDHLSAAAKALKVHVHLVAHVRKPNQAGEEHIPTKFDIRGAGELTDLVDNVFICWSDKRRATLKVKSERGITLTDKELEYFNKNPDQRLITAKQRHGSWEGQIGLWFSEASLQFAGDDSGKSLFFDFGQQENLL